MLTHKCQNKNSSGKGWFYLKQRESQELRRRTEPQLNLHLVVRLTIKSCRIRQGIKDGAKLDLQGKPKNSEGNWKDMQSTIPAGEGEPGQDSFKKQGIVKAVNCTECRQDPRGGCSGNSRERTAELQDGTNGPPKHYQVWRWKSILRLSEVSAVKGLSFSSWSKTIKQALAVSERDR